jgi:hypothetical protein
VSLSGPSQVIVVEPIEAPVVAPVSAERERVEPPAPVRSAPDVAALESEPDTV